MADAAEASGEEEPLVEHRVTLDFSFEFELPDPPVAAEGETAEGAAPAPATPAGLEGTFFELTLPAEPVEGEEEAGITVLRIAHPLTAIAPPPAEEPPPPRPSSGKGKKGAPVVEEAPPPPLSPSAELLITPRLVRWLVEDQQGVLPLSLRRPAGGETVEVFALPVDVCGLLFGKQSVRLSCEPWPPPGEGTSAGGGEAPPDSERVELPPAAAGLMRSMAIEVHSDVPFLSDELAQALNPLSVTLVRADDLPPNYSGTPFKAPYVDLSERCRPVFVKCRVLGHEFTSSERAHGSRLVWRERHLYLAGREATVRTYAIEELLREEGLRIELHDRDPKPPPPPPPPAPPPAVAEPPAEAPPAAKGKKGKTPKTPPKKEAPPPAAEPELPPAEDPPPEGAVPPVPHGVAFARLGHLLPRRPTEGAYYAPGGIPTCASRRESFCLTVLPCERPKEPPEPEDDDSEFFAGAYLEHGTSLTLELEFAAPLPPEEDATAPVELQRIVTLVKYDDNATLHALLRIVNTVNAAIGMNSASAWEAYKDAKRDDLDLLTGLQLVDSETRLFILEGHAASGSNGMAQLGALLERTEANSAKHFTLMNTSIVFRERLYCSFEMPTKMIKLRSSLPYLLSKPEVFKNLAVHEGCRKALMALSGLLTAPSMRAASKHNGCFPSSYDLLQMEKKYGGVHLVADRDGVLQEDDDDSVSSVGEESPSGQHRRRSGKRKAPTDTRNPKYLSTLATWSAQPAPDWIQRNIDELPPSAPRKPLPDWYLASIPRIEGVAHVYSGQKLNPLEVHKANLRATFERMAKTEKRGVSYASEYLWADNMGEREMDPPKPEQLQPWNKTAKVLYNRDGTVSAFRMLQPTPTRLLEMTDPFDAPATAKQVANLMQKHAEKVSEKPRFDCNPTAARMYLDANPAERFASIFKQTEEQIIAEQKARVDGEIASWMSKVVVDDPVVHVGLRVQDRPLQTDRVHGILKDPPGKKAIKSLYRGKKPLTYGDGSFPEPSAFMHESTIEELTKFETNLRPFQPQKWSGTKDFNSTMNQSKSALPQTVESKRSIRPLKQADYSTHHFSR